MQFRLPSWLTVGVVACMLLGACATPIRTTSRTTPTWRLEVAEVLSISRVVVFKSNWDTSRHCVMAIVDGVAAPRCTRQVVLVRPYTESFTDRQMKKYMITYRYLDELHVAVIDTYQDEYIRVFVDNHNIVQGPPQTP